MNSSGWSPSVPNRHWLVSLMISFVGVKFKPYFSARSTGSSVRLVMVPIHLSTTTMESGVGLSESAAIG